MLHIWHFTNTFKSTIVFNPHYIPSFMKNEKMSLKEVKLLPKITQVLSGGPKTHTRPPISAELIFHSSKQIHLEANLSPCLDIRHPGFPRGLKGQISYTRPCLLTTWLTPLAGAVSSLFLLLPREWRHTCWCASRECHSVAAEESTQVPDGHHLPSQISVPL